ncbi:MAG: hypothetical protein COY42_03565 [Armatimonadetes bacterium CG_4_10_14_0_8_um_filter_66_14]|nr:MAG: hypothetical protein COY42_03565 [Armatimonadetes bacterium CG_4_10_14_0_8_um_filter_66_14]
MAAAVLCGLLVARVGAAELLTNRELAAISGGPGIGASNCSTEDSYAQCQYDNGGDCPQILNCEHGHGWNDSMATYRTKVDGNQVVFMHEKPTCSRCDCTRDANYPYLCVRVLPWQVAEPQPIHCTLQQ